MGRICDYPKEPHMKHLVLTKRDGYVEYRMGNQMGSHPIGDDPVSFIIDYLIKIIKPTTYEVL